MESAIKQLQYDLKAAQQEKVREETCCFNPLSSNCDQHQISPCDINAYSTPMVMRIKDMITQGEFLDVLRRDILEATMPNSLLLISRDVAQLQSLLSRF